MLDLGHRPTEPKMHSISAVRISIFVTIGFLACLTIVSGCNKFAWMSDGGQGGGGQDTITIDMPFENGYTSLCVQGAGGSYSHSASSTEFDVDFDTPNNTDDLVFAPVSGTAYMHDDGSSGFGIHTNIDVDGSSYIVIGHQAEVLFANGQEVAAGQIIGIEGTTGNSTGDHVHIGRHNGSADEAAGSGVSLEGLAIRATDASTGEEGEFKTSSLICDIDSGHYYTSMLKTAKWHPSGTLVKTPQDPEVYRIWAAEAHQFTTENVFWDLGYDFDNVTLISGEELACYPFRGEISQGRAVAAYEDETVWLIVEENSTETLFKVSSVGWQEVLKSWGITAATYDDLASAKAYGIDLNSATIAKDQARFRDGALLKEASSTTVYHISDGIAAPIEDQNTFLLMGFSWENIIEVETGLIAAVQGQVGDCGSDIYCIRPADVTVCGASDSNYRPGGSYPSGTAATTTTGSAFTTDTGESPSTGTTSESPTSAPDDLNENLDWIAVDGAAVGINVSMTFPSGTDGTTVAATGYGIDTDWGYEDGNVDYYDEDTDFAWYEFDDGRYRVTFRTQSEWAMYNTYCESDTQKSDLCHQNQDTSFALCFETHQNSISPLSTSECREME